MKTCSVDGCTRVARYHLCEAHTSRVRRHGDPQADRPVHGQVLSVPRVVAEVCAVPGCGRPRTANRSRWCSAHRERRYRHGDVRADVPVRSGESRAARYQPTVLDLEDTDEL
jgi:hypothetical protein